MLEKIKSHWDDCQVIRVRHYWLNLIVLGGSMLWIGLLIGSEWR
jgi:hypothetical protein